MKTVKKLLWKNSTLYQKKLTLMSDVRQSPLIALMNTLAWQGQTGQQREGLSDSIIQSAKELVGGRPAGAAG